MAITTTTTPAMETSVTPAIPATFLQTTDATAKNTNDAAEKTLRFVKDFTAGWAGGIAQVLVGQPFDTVKVLLQASPQNAIASGGTIRFALDTINKEGLSGLYRASSFRVV